MTISRKVGIRIIEDYWVLESDDVNPCKICVGRIQTVSPTDLMLAVVKLMSQKKKEVPSPGVPIDTYVSISDAAKKLQVSVSTLRRLATSHKIKCVRTPGGHRRISVASIHCYLSAEN